MARSKATTKVYPKAPDGGYGWIIVFSSFMIHFLADGITYTFGIFYVELLQHFKAGKGITAWVPSIMTGITYGIGPIASGLTNKYGCRTITIIGALFASFGLMTSAFAPNVTYLFFSIGICAGAGLGLIYLPAIVSVTCYFEKRRAFATGIAVCGSGIGSAAFAPLTEWLIGIYGWRGGLLIISGFLLNCCVFGALLRPLKEKETDTDEEKHDDTVDPNNNRNGIKVDLKTVEDTINDVKNKPRNVIISKKISPEKNDIDIKNAANGDIMINKSCYGDNNNNDQSIVGSLSSVAYGSNNTIINNYSININSLSNDQFKEIPMLTISEPLSPSRHSICALYPSLSNQLSTMESTTDKTKCEPLIVTNNYLNGSIISNGNITNFNGYSNQSTQRLNNTSNVNHHHHHHHQNVTIQANEQTSTDQPNVIQRRKHSVTSSCGILYRRDIFYSASLMHLNLPTNTKSNQKLSYSASTSAVNDLSTSSIASESTTPDVGTSGVPMVNSKSNCLPHSQTTESKSKYMISHSSSLSLTSSSSSSSSTTTSSTTATTTASSTTLSVIVSKFKWYCMSDCMTFLCSDEVRDTLDEMMDFRLLRNPIFLIFSISNFLTALGFYVPHIYIKDRVVGLKLASDSEASNLLAIMGIASTFGRLIFGFISDLKIINRLLLFNCCITLCGLSTILSSFVQTYTYMALYCALFGVTCGAYVSLTSVILVDLLGIEKLTNAFGLVLLFQGVACLIGPPIVGWMFDLTGSYDPGFSWAGSMILIGGLILFLLPHITHGRLRLNFHNNKRKTPKVIVNDVNLG